MRDWWSSERSRIVSRGERRQPIGGRVVEVDLVNPPKPQLILVDHNELGQAVLGADEADILEVLDHHRIGGGLKTAQPIRFINDPVGSTCTLVARQFRANGIEPNAGVALCMASGIISDTLFLRSPTPRIPIANALNGFDLFARWISTSTPKTFSRLVLASFVHFDRSCSRGLQRI